MKCGRSRARFELRWDTAGCKGRCHWGALRLGCSEFAPIDRRQLIVERFRVWGGLLVLVLFWSLRLGRLRLASRWPVQPTYSGQCGCRSEGSSKCGLYPRSRSHDRCAGQETGTSFDQCVLLPARSLDGPKADPRGPGTPRPSIGPHISASCRAVAFLLNGLQSSFQSLLRRAAQQWLVRGASRGQLTMGSWPTLPHRRRCVVANGRGASIRQSFLPCVPQFFPATATVAGGEDLPLSSSHRML